MEQLQLSVFTKGGGPLTKILRLQDGKVVSDASQCTLSRGLVNKVKLTLNQLPALFSQLQTNQAIATGWVNDDVEQHEILPRKAYEEAGYTGASALLPHGNYATRTLESMTQSGPSLIMFDFDRDDANPHQFKTPEEFISALATVIPDFDQISFVRTYSTSTSVYHRDTHECVRAADGWHIYMAIADGSDLGRFGEVLAQRLWLAGYGYCKVSPKSAAVNMRCIVDTAVFSPERLVFEAGAVIPADQPIYQKLPAPEYHQRRLPMLDTHSLKELYDAELLEFENAQKRAKLADKVQNEVARVRLEMFDRAKKEAAERGMALTDSALRKVVENLERQIIPPWHVLKFDDGREVTVFQAFCTPHLFDNCGLLDPLREDKGQSKAMFYANGEHGMYNPVIHSFVEGGRNFHILDSVQMLHRQTLDSITKALSEKCDETIIQNSQYLEPFDCSGRGIYLIKAEKGVGKTYGLSQMLKDDPGRLLVVTHRISLTNAVASQFGATSYQEESMDAAYRLRAQKRLAICYDSLHKLDQQYYHTVVIDEVTQLMRHVKAMTVEQKYICLNVLKSVLRGAHRVFLMDADLTTDFLNLLLDPQQGCLPRAKLILVANKYLPAKAQNRTIRVLKTMDGKPDETMLSQEMLACAKAGEGFFYAANSSTDVIRKAALLLKGLGYRGDTLSKEHFMTEVNGRRVITITGDNSSEPEVRAFVADINGAIRENDILLASPSMGTGVSINAIDGQPRFTRTFARFTKRAGNVSRDCAQHLARVRECRDFTMVVTSHKELRSTIPQDIVDREVLGKLRVLDRRTRASHGLNFNPHTRWYEFADGGWASWLGYLTALENRDRNDFEEHLLEGLDLEGYTIVTSDLGLREAGVEAAVKLVSTELKDHEMELRKAVPLISLEEKQALDAKRYLTADDKRRQTKRVLSDLFGETDMERLNNIVTSSDDNIANLRAQLILAADPEQLFLLDLANRFDQSKMHIAKTAYYDTYRTAMDFLALFNIRLDDRGLPDAYCDEVKPETVDLAYTWMLERASDIQVLFGIKVSVTLDPMDRGRAPNSLLKKLGFTSIRVSRRVEVDGQKVPRKVRVFDRTAIEQLRSHLSKAKANSTSQIFKLMNQIPNSLVEYVANAAAGYPEKVPTAHLYVMGLEAREKEYVQRFVQRFARQRRQANE
jgi:hypothetical protein